MMSTRMRKVAVRLTPLPSRTPRFRQKDWCDNKERCTDARYARERVHDRGARAGPPQQPPDRGNEAGRANDQSGGIGAHEVGQLDEGSERGILLAAEILQHRRELRQHEQNEEQHDAGRGHQHEGRVLHRVGELAAHLFGARPLRPQHVEHLVERARDLADAHQRAVHWGNRAGWSSTASARLSPLSSAARSFPTTGRNRPTSESLESSSSAASRRAPALSSNAMSRVKVVISAALGRPNQP